MDNDGTVLRDLRRTTLNGLGLQVLVWIGIRFVCGLSPRPALDVMGLFATAGLAAWIAQAAVANLLLETARYRAAARVDGAGGDTGGESLGSGTPEGKTEPGLKPVITTRFPRPDWWLPFTWGCSAAGCCFL